MPSPVSLVDVTHSVPPEPLVPREGQLEPYQPGTFVIQRFLLGTLAVRGSRWPSALREINISADLWAFEHEGKTLWLATVVFMNTAMENTVFGFGPTYRVDLPDGGYDAALDPHIKVQLRSAVLQQS